MGRIYKKENFEIEKINLLRFLFDSKERMKENFNLEKAIGQKYILYSKSPSALNPKIREIISEVKNEFRQRYQ